MPLLLPQISKVLRSRVARNVYLWVILLFVVLDMNYNNERAYHYGIVQSPLYYPVIICGTLLQMTLIYVNNLLLAPIYLRSKRYGMYILLAFLLALGVSLIYTLGVKSISDSFNIDNMQQIGFISAPISKGWSASAIWDDMSTYLIGNMLWILMFTMAWYMNDYARQQKIAEAAQRKQVETELHFLKDQINPHFLFNTLNNLYGLALKKTDNAPDAILKLSSILRYLLYESNSGNVSFEKEKDIMQAYIELELLRITDTSGLQFYISADGSYSLPPLLWLPVLENLFKHGTRTLDENYVADFNFSIEKGIVSIKASNNYKGTATLNGNSKTGGIGLANLQKRLTLLYPGKHSIAQHKDEQNYTIEVEIALS